MEATHDHIQVGREYMEKHKGQLTSAQALARLVGEVDGGRLDFNDRADDGEVFFEVRMGGKHVGFVGIDPAGRIRFV